MLFLGIINPIVNGPLLAAVQAAVAPEMQGRVFTLINSMAAGMSPIGLIIAGPISDKLGVQTWFIIGGIVTGLMGVTSIFIPAIMNFEKGHEGLAVADTGGSLQAKTDRKEPMLDKTIRARSVGTD